MLTTFHSTLFYFISWIDNFYSEMYDLHCYRFLVSYSTENIYEVSTQKFASRTECTLNDDITIWICNTHKPKYCPQIFQIYDYVGA